MTSSRSPSLSTSAGASLAHVAAPDRILAPVLRARQALFKEGRPDTLGVRDDIVRGWTRCLHDGRRPQERIAFEPIGKAQLVSVDETYHELVETAKPELRALAATLCGAGYGVFFTNAQGVNLHSEGAPRDWGDMMRLLGRHGVDLSEGAVGSTALSNAVMERAPVIVYRDEHFMEVNRVFECVAAPVFDPGGELIAVVDATRDRYGAQLDALRLVETCAAMIESALVARAGEPQSPSVLMWLAWHPQRAHPLDTALLAFGRDGELRGANQIARRLLGESLWGVNGTPCFADLFEGSLGQVFTRCTQTGRPVQVRLLNGLTLYATLAQTSKESTTHTPVALPRAPFAGLDQHVGHTAGFAHAPHSVESDALPIQAGNTTVAQAECNAIERALDLSGGNISRAARALGISRATLHRRLKAGVVH